jgi:hypothetical protein
MDQGDVVVFLGIVGVELLFLVVGGVGLFRQPEVDNRKLWWIPLVSLLVFGVAVGTLRILVGEWLGAVLLGTIVGLIGGLTVLGIINIQYVIGYLRNKIKNGKGKSPGGDS